MRVTALSTTPVKGLRIARRERVEIERGGARGDRCLYLIDERARMVNGKHSGALSEVVAELADDGEGGGEGDTDGDTDALGAKLTLTFPDGSEVSATTELGEELDTRFFSRERRARVVRGPFARAISEHAGESLRLVRAADGTRAIDRGGEGAVTLISRASLASLADVAGEPRVDARRFRMTVEIDGVGPFAEDAWIGEELAIGAARVRVRGHVGRCIVTSRHPETGVVDLPTLDVLRSFRAEEPTSEPLAFGIYCEVLEPGAVALGDAVTSTPSPSSSGTSLE